MQRKFVYTLALKLALAFACVTSTAQSMNKIPDDLKLVDITTCRRPSVQPPPPMKETYEQYNFERRYLDLDGSGQCVLMDFWVERLGGNPSPGMRTLDHRFFRIVGGKWKPFETSLQYFPLLLRSATTGKSYLVVAPDDDIDDVAGGGIQPTAYMYGRWETDNPNMIPTYTLLPVDQGRSAIYRALAVQLQQLIPKGKRMPAEEARIKALLAEAADVDAGISPARLR